MLKNAQKDFIQRHIGPSVNEQNTMLKELGYKNLDDLIKDTHVLLNILLHSFTNSFHITFFIKWQITYICRIFFSSHF